MKIYGTGKTQRNGQGSMKTDRYTKWYRALEIQYIEVASKEYKDKKLRWSKETVQLLLRSVGQI